MNIDFEATDKCFDCYEKFDVEHLYGICHKCFEKRMLVELIDDAIDEVSDKPYNWEDKDCYQGFKNDAEKELFMSGIKRGYWEALFWIAEFFGRTEFYEKSINQKFYKKESDKNE